MHLDPTLTLDGIISAVAVLAAAVIAYFAARHGAKTGADAAQHAAEITAKATADAVREQMRLDEETRRLDRRTEAYFTLRHAVLVIGPSVVSLPKIPLAAAPAGVLIGHAGILIPNFILMWLWHDIARLHTMIEEGWRALAILGVAHDPSFEQLRESYSDYVESALKRTALWRPKTRKANQDLLVRQAKAITKVIDQAIDDLDKLRQHRNEGGFLSSQAND